MNILKQKTIIDQYVLITSVVQNIPFRYILTALPRAS